MAKLEPPKKHRKHRKKIYIFLFAAAGLIILIGIGFFLLNQKTPDSLYVFPENPKQGGTVFVRVKSESGKVTGNFGNEKLIFYKNDLPEQTDKLNEWIALKGIDAGQKPGNYKVSVDIDGVEKFTKEVNVVSTDFASLHPAVTPKPVKAGNVAKLNKIKQKVAENITKTDNSAIDKVLSSFTDKPYFTSAFAYPLDKMKISGYPFGEVVGFGKYGLRHFGDDLGAPEKTNVYAVNDGRVVLTTQLPDYGKTIIIDHGLDIFSMYLHLSEFDIAPGDKVRKGQVIALSGKTGYVSGPHLHFSIRVGNSRVDPIAFIDATQKMDDEKLSFIASLSQAFYNFIKKAGWFTVAIS